MNLFTIDKSDCHLTIWYWRGKGQMEGQHTKCINIGWHYKWWSRNGTGMIWGYRDNGAKRENGDTCLDQTISLGYLTLNHINWNLQGARVRRNS